NVSRAGTASRWPDRGPLDPIGVSYFPRSAAVLLDFRRHAAGDLVVTRRGELWTLRDSDNWAHYVSRVYPISSSRARHDRARGAKTGVYLSPPRSSGCA